MSESSSELTQPEVTETTNLTVYDIAGNPTHEVRMPRVFRTAVRPDVIKRAVLSVQSFRFQPQGRDPLAGKRGTAVSRGVGLGIARVPRVKGGGPRAGQAAMAPGTVGGRLAHPPKSQKIIVKRLNLKERRLAIRSALAATAQSDLVKKRGHFIPESKTLPIIVEDRLEELKDTKSVLSALKSLGLQNELYRTKLGLHIRAGKGKRRGRRYKQAKGPLIVVNTDKGLIRAASNIPGVDAVAVQNLNAELLAPGTHVGRLAIWTESAIKKLEESRLFS